MKQFMSNREFKRERKYFKNIFAEGALTQDVCESERYKTFEMEEEKRRKSKDYVKEWLVKEEANRPFYIDKSNENIKENLYLKKYAILDEKRNNLRKQVFKLEDEKKIDGEARRKFCDEIYQFRDFRELVNDIDSACNNIKANLSYLVNKFLNLYRVTYMPENMGLFNSIAKYEKEYEEAFLQLRRDTCAFSFALKEYEKMLRKLKRRKAEFVKIIKVQDAKTEAKEKNKAIEDAFSHRNNQKLR